MKLYKEIENSFPLIEKLFSEEELLEFINTPVADLCLYHFGLGTSIRNNLLYCNDNLLYKLFLENGVEHPDVMSSIIINLFHYFFTTGSHVSHLYSFESGLPPGK